MTASRTRASASGGRSSAPARVREAEIAARTQIVLQAMPWLGWVAIVLISWVPLQAVQPMVEDVSGKHTDVTLSISISVVINVLLGGTYLVQRARIKRQQRELIRLRGRLEEIDKSRVPGAGS